MKFGENLKILRKQQKISQEDLAEKVKVSRQSVSKWETGEAYPEMNNILQLCKIFNCHINDLVHEDMSDIDHLDDDIKITVVKFKKEKQKKMKAISKFIYIFSLIFKVIAGIVSAVSALFVLIVPFIFNKFEIVENKLHVGNYEIKLTDNLDEVDKIKSVIESHSNIELIIYVEIVIIFIIVTWVLLFIISNKLEKLFKNMYNGDTPFTLENIMYIKKIAKYLILSIIIPIVSGFIMQIVINTDLGIEVSVIDIVLVIIVYSISYIFEYGYELQKDSKGVMYGKSE